MRNKIGMACMGLGIVLMLAALSLFLWNQWEDSRAGALSEEILPQVVMRAGIPDAAREPETAQETEPGYPDPYDPAMTETEIDGYAYVGFLMIPDLDLDLPVMSEWDYDRLKIAPCRYAGSTKTEDLVICAHNYTQHFGSLHNLSDGATVWFVDMDGKMWRYEVAAVEILSPTDVEDMTAGDYDLTLFTCTYGGASRVTVRCLQADADAED